MIRAFEDYTGTVSRAVHTEAAGTDDPDVTFAAVAGMSTLPMALQPISASKVPSDLGIIYGRAYLIQVDHDLLPSAGQILDGDRIAIGADTYTVREALYVQNQTGRMWRCTAELKTR